MRATAGRRRRLWRRWDVPLPELWRLLQLCQLLRDGIGSVRVRKRGGKLPCVRRYAAVRALAHGRRRVRGRRGVQSAELHGLLPGGRVRLREPGLRVRCRGRGVRGLQHGRAHLHGVGLPLTKVQVHKPTLGCGLPRWRARSARGLLTGEPAFRGGLARRPRAPAFREAPCAPLGSRGSGDTLKLVQSIVGTKELAEVFLLALDGLEADLPSTAILRRRVQVLVDRFVA